MSEICTASLLPADFAHFSCGKGAKRSDYWLTKRSGEISSPGAQLLPGTGHLKWRHVYVIMTTEFDYFEHDHILYTVGNNCKKRKKYPSCCAMLALPHFSSVRKTETVKPGEEIMPPLPQSITILLSSDKILSGFMKSIASACLFAMLHVRNPTGSCMKQQKEAL